MKPEEERRGRCTSRPFRMFLIVAQKLTVASFEQVEVPTSHTS